MVADPIARPLTPSPPPRLRVGLLVDEIAVTKYVYAIAEWAQTHPNIRITHLIVHAAYEGARSSNLVCKLMASIRRDGLYHAISRVLFFVITALEKQIIRKSRYHKNHLHRYDLSTLVENKVRIKPIVSQSGFVNRFAEEDVSRIKCLDLDLLIRCGGGILRGGILNSARLGIISFHHADNRVNRGSPAGFWEVYLRQDTTGFTIQRLTEELDGGQVIMRGRFPTRFSYLLNQAALYEKANQYLKAVLEGIAISGKLPAISPNVPYSHRLYRVPKAHQSLIYLGCLLARIAVKISHKVLGVHHRWNVAFSRSDWRDTVLWRGVRLQNPPGRFLADPFVISRDGKDFCYVEDYCYQERRGCIAVYELKNGTSSRVGVALREEFHLSFPYLFEYEGELYMCPESCEKREIRVYKCVSFPLSWRLEEVIMKEVSAVDTMLFEKDGIWWMFTNIEPVLGGDHCSELFIFSSSSPLGTNWRSHGKNPIFVDASRARNGGLVRDGDRIFRVAQKQGFDAYGKESSINEIVKLDQAEYVEKRVVKITPAFRSDIAGTHHLHSNGKITVFDYVYSSTVRR